MLPALLIAWANFFPPSFSAGLDLCAVWFRPPGPTTPLSLVQPWSTLVEYSWKHPGGWKFSKHLPCKFSKKSKVFACETVLSSDFFFGVFGVFVPEAPEMKLGAFVNLSRKWTKKFPKISSRKNNLMKNLGGQLWKTKVERGTCSASLSLYFRSPGLPIYQTRVQSCRRRFWSWSSLELAWARDVDFH